MENAVCSHKLEISSYTIIWISSVLYAIVSFTRQSSKYFSSYTDEYDDFKKGYFGDRKDSADLEWSTMLYLYKHIWIWIVVKLLISELLKINGFSKGLKLFEISITIVFVFKYLGPVALFGILAQPILFQTVYRISSKKSVLWITNIITIFIISFYKYKISNEYYMTKFKFNEKENYLHILAIYWTNLRTFSYFMEENSKKSSIDLLSYCLYLPVLFNGPFIFHSDYQKEPMIGLKERCLQLLTDFVRFTFWLLFIEFFLHYIYVNATSYQAQLIDSLDGWGIYGYGYLMGQYFHMKYLVIYGLSTSIARFENISVPSLPKCIGRIHLYSDMWKYFDNGLYKFLLRYIYVPTLQFTKDHKLLGSLFCFLFVYIWHGLETYILIWVVLNFIGIVIENGASSIYKTYMEDLEIIEYIGTKNVRRMTCFLASFLLAMSALSNFYFFAGLDVGTTFFSRILEDSILSKAILIIALYCCCQISTELRGKSDVKVKNG